jgi:hypothetical protein
MVLPMELGSAEREMACSSNYASQNVGFWAPSYDYDQRLLFLGRFKAKTALEVFQKATATAKCHPEVQIISGAQANPATFFISVYAALENRSKSTAIVYTEDDGFGDYLRLEYSNLRPACMLSTVERCRYPVGSQNMFPRRM